MSAEPLAEVLNPVDAERWIRETSDRIARGVKIVTAAERQARDARREFDRAYAQAYVGTDAPAHVRRYEADIVTMPLREAAETAETALRHAERTARALEKELMAAQSILASIRSMYSAAGVPG